MSRIAPLALPGGLSLQQSLSILFRNLLCRSNKVRHLKFKSHDTDSSHEWGRIVIIGLCCTMRQIMGAAGLYSWEWIRMRLSVFAPAQSKNYST